MPATADLPSGETHRTQLHGTASKLIICEPPLLGPAYTHTPAKVQGRPQWESVSFPGLTTPSSNLRPALSQKLLPVCSSAGICGWVTAQADECTENPAGAVSS